jgi:hypothetical protein
MQDSIEKQLNEQDSLILSVNNLNLNKIDKTAVSIIDEADLEYDEDFASLVVDQGKQNLFKINSLRFQNFF